MLVIFILKIFQETVETILRTQRPEIHNPKRPGTFFFVHRLDYSSSGLLCIAKNVKACAVAGKAFQERKVDKYYLAILRGHISTDSLDISYDIGEKLFFIYMDKFYASLKISWKQLMK